MTHTPQPIICDDIWAEPDKYPPGTELWCIYDTTIKLGVLACTKTKINSPDNKIKYFIPYRTSISLDWTKAKSVKSGTYAWTYANALRIAKESDPESEDIDTDYARQIINQWREELSDDIASGRITLDTPVTYPQYRLLPNNVHKTKIRSNPHHYNLPVTTDIELQTYKKTVIMYEGLIVRAIRDYIAEQMDIDKNSVYLNFKTDLNREWFIHLVNAETNPNIQTLLDKLYEHHNVEPNPESGTMTRKLCEKILAKTTGLSIRQSVKNPTAKNVIFLCR